MITLQPAWVGPAGVTVSSPPNPFPTLIASSGSWNSGIISMQGCRGITAAVTSTQAGNISIQRYADAAGLIAVGTVLTQAITANTPATVSVNDGLPALYFQVTITNSSASTAATITYPAIIMTGM
jgi:hypothetical protein